MQGQRSLLGGGGRPGEVRRVRRRTGDPEGSWASTAAPSGASWRTWRAGSGRQMLGAGAGCIRVPSSRRQDSAGGATKDGGLQRRGAGAASGRHALAAGGGAGAAAAAGDGRAEFMPEAAFRGRREGYAFRKGARGLGYYLEAAGKPARAVRPEPPRQAGAPSRQAAASPLAGRHPGADGEPEPVQAAAEAARGGRQR